jgi:signal transduction histidine kinase
VKGARVRTVVASLLTAAALAALLIGWIGAGWAGVRAEVASRQRAVRADGEQAARGLAAALDARLEELRRREAQRPYFHYQSLFRDPLAGAEGLAVTPSPLASGPDDPLVRAHFQIDGGGRVSMPTINDELPELSEPAALADNRALRDALTAAAPTLRAVDVPVIVAAAEPAQVAEKKPRPTKRGKQAPLPTKVVVDIDPDVYAQNAQSVDVYKQTRNIAPAAFAEPAPKPAPRPAPKPSPVQITVAPPEWRATPVAGALALVLVRAVETPDGALSQGALLDGDAVADWLAERAGDHAVTLRPRSDAPALPVDAAIAPLAAGAWSVAVDLGAARRAGAAAADDLRRGFLLRLVPVALLALISGVLVVLLVARAERLAQQRASFAAAAAHELRTPLAGLQLYGDMLADGLGDPGKQRDYARRLAEEASRLGRVVSNVLGFSQLERGNLSVHAVARPLAPIIAAAVERARPVLERAGASLEVDASVDGAGSARLDEDALLRILGNLLDNAEKYGRGAADRRVHIDARRAGATVEIAVRDHGPGIDDRLRRRLFRAFSRPGGSDRPAGLGLGLALSRSLARAMGGDLVYRPASGAGATFVVVLASEKPTAAAATMAPPR